MDTYQRSYRIAPGTRVSDPTVWGRPTGTVELGPGIRYVPVLWDGRDKPEMVPVSRLEVVPA